MVTVAPAERCAPCLYGDFQDHYRACSICQTAPTANAFCLIGLSLLDASLGDAGKAPPPPTNAMTRDLSEVAFGVLADELRTYTVLYRHSPTKVDEVRPWGGEAGDEMRRGIVRRFIYMNRCVLTGVVSDWREAPRV